MNCLLCRTSLGQLLLRAKTAFTEDTTTCSDFFMIDVQRSVHKIPNVRIEADVRIATGSRSDFILGEILLQPHAFTK